MSQSFHLFVSDVNQGIKDVGWVQDFLAWSQGWKDPPYIFRKLLKIEWDGFQCGEKMGQSPEEGIFFEMEK